MAMLTITHGVNIAVDYKLSALNFLVKTINVTALTDPMLVKLKSIERRTGAVYTMGFAVTVGFGVGVLTVKMNCKYILMMEAIVSCALGFAAPFLTMNMPSGDIIIACAKGILTGLHYPAAYCMIAKWMPQDEWCRGVAIVVYCGNYVNDFTLLVSDRLVPYIGYENSFYFVSTTVFVWGIIWFVFSSETPDKCAFITQEECSYLFKEQKYYRPVDSDGPIPWKGVFTCKPIIGIVVIAIAKVWTRKILVSRTFVYRYMELVSKSSPEASKNTLDMCLSMRPLASFLFAYFADKMLLLNYSGNSLRKTFSSIGLYGAGLSLAIMLYAKGERALLFYMLFVSFNEFGCICGFETSVFQLSPIYVGLVSGVIIVPAGLSMIGLEFIILSLVKDSGNPEQLEDLFKVVIVLSFIGNLLFCTTGDYVKQPFDSVGTIEWKRVSVESYPPMTDKTKPTTKTKTNE